MNITIDAGQILQGIAAILLIVVPYLSLRASQKNAEKIDTVVAQVNDSKVTLGQLEKTTNSLSERNEAIAKKLGIEEGKKIGRAEHKAEQAADALAIKKSGAEQLIKIPNRPKK